MTTRAANDHRARRRVIRRARAAAALALVAPALWIALADLARRAPQIARYDAAHLTGYLCTVVASAAFWAAILYASASRAGWLRQIAAGLFVVLFTLAVGVEGAFFSVYRTYLSLDSQVYAYSIPLALIGTLPFERPLVPLHLALAPALAFAFLIAARRFVRPRLVRPALRAFTLFIALFVAFVMPVSYRTVQSTTPDLIYFHGVAALFRDRLERAVEGRPLHVQLDLRHPEPVPEVTPKPARPRNVLLLLQESQRADVTCTAYDPACDRVTKATNRAAPDRLPLLQLRANASATAIAISNLWTGVDPTESKERLLAAPQLWDYARAAGYDTAYWTSQNLMFANTRLYVQDLAARHFVAATELDGAADLFAGAPDELLSDYAVAHLDELAEPFFGVIHYSNIHRPRIVDPARAPYQPSSGHDSPVMGLADINRYKNAVYLSDLAVAKLLEHLRRSDRGRRTVVVFTSDHGESYHEHRQEDEHASSLYDEEIHVPGWIDAPPDTLAPEERQSLADAKDQFVWQLDLAATMMDLLGLWDAPELAPFRARMIGRPLTRPERSSEPMPITNVSWLWEYYYPNWGLMQGSLKVMSRPGESVYRCHDVIEDPFELKQLPPERCASLLERTRAFYKVTPGQMQHLRDRPDWAAR